MKNLECPIMKKGEWHYSLVYPSRNDLYQLDFVSGEILSKTYLDYKLRAQINYFSSRIEVFGIITGVNTRQVLGPAVFCGEDGYNRAYDHLGKITLDLESLSEIFTAEQDRKTNIS
ncbi:MAG: hypothetical protein QXK37_01440 [Candidatus Woesearchaeota archaeon]